MNRATVVFYIILFYILVKIITLLTIEIACAGAPSYEDVQNNNK